MIKKFFLFILKSVLLFGTISAFTALFLVFYYTKDLPDYSQLAKYHPPLTTRIYSSDGKLIEQYAKENRIFVSIDSVPLYLVQAFIAAEDKNFFDHQGIDFIGILRAAISNVNNVINNRRLEGASTITQQVVKNFLLTNERSIARKVKEAVLSYMVSKTFSKQQILELYLNQTFFGKGSYGVASAAQTYFNKSVEDLTIAEASFIAGLPKAPSKFDPIKNYDRSKERRDYVINRMLEDGYISVSEAEEALKTPIILKSRDKNNLVKAPYFAEAVRAIVSDLYGNDEFYTEGFTIITTLDSAMQKDAEESFVQALRQYDRLKGYRKALTKISLENWQAKLNEIPAQAGAREYEMAVVLSSNDHEAIIGLKSGGRGKIPLSDVKWARTNIKSVSSILKAGDVIFTENIGQHYALRQIPEVNGGFVVIDPSNGCVRAHVGGYDFDVNKFDRILQAKRQPGSAVKSFVYLSALERGIEPNRIFEDAPIEIIQGPGMPSWRPKNYKGDFLGAITFRTALEKSRNLVTVRVAKQVGIRSVAEMISRVGINSAPPIYYSMILGSLETTLSQMANAYGIVANGGFQIVPSYIELIQDKNGKILYKRDDSECIGCSAGDENHDIPEIKMPAKKSLIDSASCYQLTSILEGAVTRGTSSRLAKHKIPLAAKTGTTNNSYDTWNIAYTPDLVMGTYVGFDNPRTMGKTATGASVALPVIDIFLEKISHKLSKAEFEVPDNIELVRVDRATGQLTDSKSGIIEALKMQKSQNIIDNSEESENIVEDDMLDDIMTKEQKIEFFENIGEVY